jgi:membrane protein required for colicin V production
MTLNAVDILILAVLALSTLFGLIRGFVAEVLSLACWVAAFWVASAFGPQVATYYAGWLHDQVARTLAGYISCFVGVLIVGALIGWALRRVVRYGGLGASDRFFGMLFGLARGWLLVAFVVLILGFTGLPREAQAWRRSALLPYFVASATWLADELPAPVTHRLETGTRALRRLPSLQRPMLPAPASSAIRSRPMQSVLPTPSADAHGLRNVGQYAPGRTAPGVRRSSEATACAESSASSAVARLPRRCTTD